MIPSSKFSIWVTSWWLAPVSTTASGTPRPSTRRWRLVPLFARSVGLRPKDSWARGALTMELYRLRLRIFIPNRFIISPQSPPRPQRITLYHLRVLRGEKLSSLTLTSISTLSQLHSIPLSSSYSASRAFQRSRKKPANNLFKPSAIRQDAPEDQGASICPSFPPPRCHTVVAPIFTCTKSVRKCP